MRTAITFLTPKNVFRRCKVLGTLPIPTQNKTPVSFTAVWKAELLSIFSSLPVSFMLASAALKPLGFDIFNLPSVLYLIAVRHGHPFTLGTATVVLPVNFLKKRDAWEKRTVIVHELVHLHQRRHPEEYHRYYRQQGFVKSNIAFDGALTRALMFNPDGERYEWAWQDGDRSYLPVSVAHSTYIYAYDSSAPENQHAVGRRVIGLKDLRPVKDVPAYYHRFRNKHQLYHPNEIVAHEITDALFPRHPLPG